MTADRDKAVATDVAEGVLKVMRTRGISSLPRNYELVYEFLNATNAALVRRFNALDKLPTQAQLDEVGRDFLPHHHGMSAVATANRGASAALKDLIGLFEQEQSGMRSYANLLDQSREKLSESGKASIEAIAHLANLLSSATGDTKKNGETAIRHIVESAEEIAHIKTELSEYKRLAAIDPLTKLANRRSFDERLANIFDSNGNSKSHALIVVDIDRFKKFNDTYGHPVGDSVLCVVSRVMKKCLPNEAFVARTGGEEFGIILEGVDQTTALELAEKIRLQTELTPLRDQRTGADYGAITVSIGLCMADDANNAEDLYINADKALYLSKGSGRNQTQTHSPRSEGRQRHKRLTGRS
ncbi:GGDEF domain-containing protein [Hoeflea alexandrii]|uniref:diguanylate cyclase n=1 Tax=Hoeflea alexandrii TaxID=288436 RepID=A0ABT1CV94_9HYPH|nr:GGDEF domain-containing protein [Hoeflea alexandrii]MCO6410118.1 diguanylate cyclase [Hoeflea alexandrii]MCY0153091.1 GGDEF domain-containing protein [Hoeflea alexandrii]